MKADNSMGERSTLHRVAMTVACTAFCLLVTLVGVSFYLYAFSGAPKVDALSSGITAAAVRRGSSAPQADGVAVRLDSRGVGIISLPFSAVTAEAYPFLRFQFADVSPRIRATVAVLAGGSDTVREIPIDHEFGTDLTLYLGDSPGWKGQIASMRLLFFGNPGDRLILCSVSLEPLSAAALLRHIRWGWSSDEGWVSSSSNFHRGGDQILTLVLPTPVVSLYLGVGLGLWLLLCALYRRGMPDLIPPAFTFLLAWLFLDTLWQHQLLHRAETFKEEFSGKTEEEKLRNGPDASVVAFAERIRASLDESASTRIFVAGTHSYFPLRLSYYLFPLNVYWSRQGDEIPPVSRLREGDYIALMMPTEIRIDRDTLNYRGASVPVDLLFAGPETALLRVR